jgi:hypothetical protein
MNNKGGIYFWILMCVIQHCFICRPSDFAVSEDAGMEPWTVATLASTARRSSPLAIDLINTWLDLIHTWLDLIHTWLDLIQ